MNLRMSQIHFLWWMRVLWVLVITAWISKMVDNGWKITPRYSSLSLYYVLPFILNVNLQKTVNIFIYFLILFLLFTNLFYIYKKELLDIKINTIWFFNYYSLIYWALFSLNIKITVKLKILIIKEKKLKISCRAVLLVCCLLYMILFFLCKVTCLCLSLVRQLLSTVWLFIVKREYY